MQAKEISNRKALKSVYDMSEIIDFLWQHFNVSKEEIIKNKYSELRRIAIYLIKKNTGATNSEIGDLFGGITYSAVAKSYDRINKKIKKNRKLKMKIGAIERELSKVKVRPL